MKYIYKYTMNKDLQNEICNFKFYGYTVDEHYNHQFVSGFGSGVSKLDYINNKFEYSDKPFIKYAKCYLCKFLKEVIQENTNSNKNVYGKREVLIKKLFKID